MKPAALLAQPLSEAEIEALDHFLGSDAAPEEAMDVSMMDGFITAVASGPNLMMSSELLRWIWDPTAGQASPAFADAEASQRIVGLILRHWNDVNTRLNHAPEQYEPLVMERESNGSMVSVIDEWCIGYFKGSVADRAAWAPLLAEHPEWFTVIFLYGTEDGWKELERRQDTHEQHQAFANSLGEFARRIHHYWLAQRKAQVARGELPGVLSRGEPRRRATKIGRNEPCPCGSGKKYKRCHGTAENDEGFAPENTPTQRTPVQHATMATEDSPVRSALSQRVTREGTSVEIAICGDSAGGWLLEVVDEFGNSTVWDDAFPTEAAALAQALSPIDTEGIASLVGAPPADTTRH